MSKPVSRKKEDRRRNAAPASVLGGFLKEDRRSGSDRRDRKPQGAPSRKRAP